MDTSVARLSYSIVELAELIGVSRSSVYSAIGRGELRALKFGQRTVIPMDEAQRFMASLPPARIGAVGRDA